MSPSSSFASTVNRTEFWALFSGTAILSAWAGVVNTGVEAEL